MRPLPFTTLRIEGGEPWFWDEHVERLRETAAALAIAVPTPQSLFAALPRAVGGSLRVRLTIQADGKPTAESAPYEPPSEAWRLKPVPVDSDRDVVRFKTTSRLVYDAARDAAAAFDDALLVHHDGQVLETTVANLFFAIGNEIVTPPETRPLLPGIARRRILDGCESAVERDLDENAARGATACCVSNAVLGVHPVESIEGWATFSSVELARQLKDALRIQP